MTLQESIKPSNARLISEIVIFSALSGIGAMIPIPSPVGSIALDSFPGYFMAIWRGLLSGALVGALGHFLSAFRAGFPLGYIHMAVILLMALVGAVIAKLKNKIGVIGGLAGGVAINTAGAVLAVPVYGWGIIQILTPILFLASVLNAAIAGIVYSAITKALNK